MSKNNGYLSALSPAGAENIRFGAMQLLLIILLIIILLVIGEVGIVKTQMYRQLYEKKEAELNSLMRQDTLFFLSRTGTMIYAIPGAAPLRAERVQFLRKEAALPTELHWRK